MRYADLVARARVHTSLGFNSHRRRRRRLRCAAKLRELLLLEALLAEV